MLRQPKEENSWLALSKNHLLRSYENRAWKPNMAPPTTVMTAPQNTTSRAGDCSAHSAKRLNMMVSLYDLVNEGIVVRLFCNAQKPIYESMQKREGVESRSNSLLFCSAYPLVPISTDRSCASRDARIYMNILQWSDSSDYAIHQTVELPQHTHGWVS